MSEILDNFKKYGVPLHSHMDADDLAKYWNKVPEEIKINHSSVSAKIVNLTSQKLVEKAIFTSYKVANNAFRSTRSSVVAASAVIQQNYQYPILVAVEKNAESLITSRSNILENLKTSIL